MEKYINMNDSFGGKHSVSSTKSFQTSYEQCISNLKQQLQNHKRALQMAEQIVDQYKQENQRLINQIETIRQSKFRTQQKYEVLQNLFIKLDKVKQKQLTKQTKRSQEKYSLEIQKINAKYENHITFLNQRIFYLQFEFKKLQQKQKRYQQLLMNYYQNDPNNQGKVVHSIRNNRETISLRRDDKHNNDDSLQIKNIKISPKLVTKNDTQASEERRQSLAAQSRASTSKKDSTTPSRNSFDRKTTKPSQTRLNTVQDYFSQKAHVIKTIPKRKQTFVYDDNLTDYKRLY